MSEDATTGETRNDDSEPGDDHEPDLLHGVAVAHSSDQVTLHPGRHEYRGSSNNSERMATGSAPTCVVWTI